MAASGQQTSSTTQQRAQQTCTIHHTLITATHVVHNPSQTDQRSKHSSVIGRRCLESSYSRATENMMHLGEAGRDVTALSDSLLRQFLKAGKKVVLPKEFHSGTAGLRCLRFQGRWHAVVMSTEGRAAAAALHLMPKLEGGIKRCSTSTQACLIVVIEPLKCTKAAFCRYTCLPFNNDAATSRRISFNLSGFNSLEKLSSVVFIDL